MSLKLIAPGKRKGNASYVAYGWWNGRPFERSLGTRDPEEAETRFLELQVELRRGRTTALSFTFRDAALLYLETHPHLNKAQRYWVADLMGELGDKPAAALTTVDFSKAAMKLLPKAQPTTWNRQVMVPGAAILHTAAENNRIPWVRLKKFKEKAPEPKALAKHQAMILINSATGMQRVFLLFLFKHGWRVSEVLALQWKHIDVKARTVLHRVSKNDEWKTLPLQGDVLKALLEEVPEVRRVGCVFPWGNKSNVYRWLKPYCRKLGIVFTPHMARHSFATWATNEGVGPIELMEAGGWKDIKSVKRYSRVNPARVREILDR